VNQISPAKLLNSKWTARNTESKEKHFLVTNVEFTEDGRLVSCLIEAILTKREMVIDWQELKDSNRWAIGWQ
jgi:tryptophan-rich hypothetical protein